MYELLEIIQCMNRTGLSEHYSPIAVWLHQDGFKQTGAACNRARGWYGTKGKCKRGKKTDDVEGMARNSAKESIQSRTGKKKPEKTLKTMFKEADKIGNKYQDPKDVAANKAEIKAIGQGEATERGLQLVKKQASKEEPNSGSKGDASERYAHENASDENIRKFAKEYMEETQKQKTTKAVQSAIWIMDKRVKGIDRSFDKEHASDAKNLSDEQIHAKYGPNSEGGGEKTSKKLNAARKKSIDKPDKNKSVAERALSAIASKQSRDDVETFLEKRMEIQDKAAGMKGKEKLDYIEKESMSALREHLKEVNQGTSGLNDDHKALGIKSNPTKAELDRAYRSKAKDAHPDRGGTAADFRSVNETYKKLKEKYNFDSRYSPAEIYLNYVNHHNKINAKHNEQIHRPIA